MTRKCRKSSTQLVLTRPELTTGSRQRLHTSQEHVHHAVLAYQSDAGLLSCFLSTEVSVQRVAAKL